MLNKQAMFGLALMISGGLIVAALATQNNTQNDYQNTKTAQPAADDGIARPSVQPLTADIETEQRLLAEKQKQRQALADEQAKQSLALLAEQEKARKLALQKQAEEIPTLTVQTRPEAIALAKAQEEQAKQAAKQQAELKAKQEAKAKEDKAKAAKQNADGDLQANKAEKTKSTNDKSADEKPQKPAQAGKYTVQAGDSLIRLSKQYDIPVSVLAEANNMGRNDALQKGKVITIPSAKQIKQLQVKAQERERKEAADARLTEARRAARASGSNERYAVQVALAANQKNADDLVKKFKAQGYNVSTQPDRRGVRVVIGPERSREAANALKDKINNDASVATGGAWVLQVK